MEWILFDKDGTLIEFDKSWEKIGIRLVDSLLEEYPVADKEVAHRQWVFLIMPSFLIL